MSPSSPANSSFVEVRMRRGLATALAGAAIATACLTAPLAIPPHVALADAETPVVSEVPASDAGGPAGTGQEGGTTATDPAAPSNPSPAPTLIASRADVTALTPGQTAEVELTFENTGDTAVVGAIASFSTSSGLVLVGNSSTVALPDIEAHGRQTVKVTVSALDGSANAAQSIGVETRFNYMKDGALAQASTTDSVPIPCAANANTGDGDNSGGNTNPDNPGGGGPTDTGDGDTGSGDWGGSDWSGGDSTGGADFSDQFGGTAQQTTTAGTPDKPVPNVIVNNFSYGDGTGAVASGSTFPLTFAFTNTSTSLMVENLVVSVDTGDQFTINGGTNTFYSAYLAAGDVQQQTLNLKSISSDKATPGTVTIGFKYEYVENNERKSANTEVKLTVPVYQPDRFELAEPVGPDTASVGEEATVTLSYVNKGKAAVSNVAVSITGNGITTSTPEQNVGNIESGKSGTIGLAFTPTQSGTLNLTLNVEYENANDETVTKTFPLTVDVMDDPYANMSDEELAALFGDMGDDTDGSSDQQGLPVPAIIGIAAGCVAVIVFIVVAVRRGAKKRRATQDWDDGDDWGDYGMAVPPLNEHVPVIGRGQDTIVRRSSETAHIPGELKDEQGRSGADGTKSHAQVDPQQTAPHGPQSRNTEKPSATSADDTRPARP